MPFLEVERVSKAYPGVRALDGVTLVAERGQVVGLIGENGAGKSTLLDIISGIQPPDSGQVRVDGRTIAPSNYHDASLLGVFRVFQHQGLVPNLRVCENFYLSHESHFSRAGFVDIRAMARAAGSVLTEFGHAHINPMADVGDYDFSTRQIVELLRAVALARLLGIVNPVVLLDEPTASLSREEVEFFFELIHKLKANASFVFISHRLGEVRELSDVLYVLKDGKNVNIFESGVRALTEAELHQFMVGRVRDEEFYQEAAQSEPSADVVLQIRGLSQPPWFQQVDFDLHAGEILGVGGLLGSGKSELGRAIFEGGASCSGDVRLFTESLPSRSVDDSIRRGVGYVPPERHRDGLILSFPVEWNTALPKQAISAGLLDPNRDRAEATDIVQRLAIRTPSTQTRCEFLSGGNQQKVVLGKWLVCRSHLLILDNPTNGVDVGAKQEIYALVRQLVNTGLAVLLISDDLLELIGLSHRILLMKDGQVQSVVEAPPRAKPHEADLVRSMV